MQKNNFKNILTVDVEEHYQVSAFNNAIDRQDWNKQESRVEKNTHKLLEIFSKYNVNATFFVLGMVAERYPNLVKEIQSENHEIACHGYSHKLVYTQTPQEFKDETKRSKQLLEDITGKAVNGYRAASYSITKQSLWALDTLLELGFEYDSSIFPVKHDRYGMAGTPTKIYNLKRPYSEKTLTEIPLTAKAIGKYNLPIAGGGYFRLFPYWFTQWALRSINEKEGRPFIFYLHPWEVDPEQPRIKASKLSEFRHYNNLHKTTDRLTNLLSTFNFTSINEMLTNTTKLELHTIS